MSVILNIETSGLYCSVSIAENGKSLYDYVEKEPNRHASLLPSIIETCCARAAIAYSQIDAVAVCDGPGSYTGLRIGASFAKGLCYSLEIPLITVPAFEIMVNKFEIKENGNMIMPVIQAKKDAIYFSLYNTDYQQIEEPKVVLKKDFEVAFNNIGDKTHILFSKVNTDILNGLNMFASLSEQSPLTAIEMSQLSHKFFKTGAISDFTQYEPFYLSGFGKLF